MNLMEINKREFYYSSYIDIDELVDEYGNLTGEFAYIYSDPVLARGNYSSTKGESLTTMFGDFDGYDRVLLTDLVLNEQTRLWIEDRNPGNAHDYEVVKVGASINYNAYAIKKVRVAEPFYARVYGMSLTDDKGFSLTDGDKIKPSVIKRLDYLRLEHEGDASIYRVFTFSEVGGIRKLEYVVADYDTVEIGGIEFVTLDTKTFKFPDWDFTINMVAFAPDKDIVAFWCHDENFEHVNTLETGHGPVYSGGEVDTKSDYIYFVFLPYIEKATFIESDGHGNKLLGGRDMSIDVWSPEYFMLLSREGLTFPIGGFPLMDLPKWDFILEVAE